MICRHLWLFLSEDSSPICSIWRLRICKDVHTKQKVRENYFPFQYSATHLITFRWLIWSWEISRSQMNIWIFHFKNCNKLITPKSSRFFPHHTILYPMSNNHPSLKTLVLWYLYAHHICSLTYPHPKVAQQKWAQNSETCTTGGKRCQQGELDSLTCTIVLSSDR